MFYESKQHHPADLSLFLGLKKPIVINNKVYLKFSQEEIFGYLPPMVSLHCWHIYFNLELNWRGLNQAGCYNQF